MGTTFVGPGGGGMLLSFPAKPEPFTIEIERTAVIIVDMQNERRIVRQDRHRHPAHSSGDPSNTARARLFPPIRNSLDLSPPNRSDSACQEVTTKRHCW